MHELLKTSISGFAGGSVLSIAMVAPKGWKAIPSISSLPIHSTIFFSTFQMSKILLGVDLNSTSPSRSDLLKVAAAAAIGESVATLSTHPLKTAEFMRITILGIENSKGTANKKMGSAFIRGVKHIWTQDKLKGFYTGSTSRLITSIPSSIILFTTYYNLKTQYRPLGWYFALKPDETVVSVTLIEAALWGSISGILAGFITTPLANADWGVQSDLLYGKSVGIKEELTMFRTYLSKLKERGFFGLFRSAPIRTFQSGFWSMILLAGYELTRSKLPT